ncbi:MAG: hypothetical protein WBG92_02155, partial [Thiohalocapsa sp.]
MSAILIFGVRDAKLPRNRVATSPISAGWAYAGDEQDIDAGKSDSFSGEWPWEGLLPKAARRQRHWIRNLGRCNQMTRFTVLAAIAGIVATVE